MSEAVANKLSILNVYLKAAESEFEKLVTELDRCGVKFSDDE
jgi:hypothetical protein